MRCKVVSRVLWVVKYKVQLIGAIVNHTSRRARFPNFRAVKALVKQLDANEVSQRAYLDHLEPPPETE